MPELPEVETIRRGLEKALAGARLESVEVLDAFCLSESPRRNLSKLAGRTLDSVTRFGKYLALKLGSDYLVIHLRMTGQLRLSLEKGARLKLRFDRGVLSFCDTRRLGKAYLMTEAELGRFGVGPDALAIASEDFCRRLRSRHGRLKPLLLNQRFLGGVGNIYATEALFRSGLRPLRRASSLKAREAEALYGALRDVLTLSLSVGGSSMRDYVDARGERGGMQDAWQIYSRRKGPCPRCGAALKYQQIAQRGTTWCPGCQK